VLLGRCRALVDVVFAAAAQSRGYQLPEDRGGGLLTPLHSSRGSARAAERALILDPYREKVHQRLIRPHALGGDHAAAARATQRCRELFSRELRVEPTPATLSLLAEWV
jgi:hypothetical protein